MACCQLRGRLTMKTSCPERAIPSLDSRLQLRNARFLERTPAR